MKVRTSRNGPGSEIMREAADWFVEFRDEAADARTQEDFNHWLRRSPDHIHAYLEIAGVWGDLPAAQRAEAVNVTALIADAQACSKVVPLDSAASVKDSRPLKTTEHFGSTRLAAAACVVLACAAAFFIWSSVGMRDGTDYRTAVGEQRFITLPEGSTVSLNARSRIAVYFSADQRRIELLNGQALFDVSADPTRPFVVIAGDTRVRAVGTQFDVYKKRDATVVTVLEGRVAVSAPQPSQASAKSASAASMISAGEQVTVTPKAMAPPAAVDIEAATAWTQRRLVFNITRLDEVAEEFNRYNPRSLVVEDKDLAGMKISGIYSSTDPASLLGFLRLQPGVNVVITESEIKVVPR